MRTSNLSAHVTTALLAVLIASVTGLSWDTQPPANLLTEEEFERCGLHKLDDDERLHLFRFMMATPQQCFLTPTAEARMIDRGFKPTSISGPLPLLGDDNREVLLAYRDGKAYMLDPPLIGEALVPGTYWSQGFGISWTVIMPDGDTQMYWVREELQ
jgi:hypothetical protein